MLSVPLPTFFEKATPATRPLRMSANAGPPLLPGLMAAAAWGGEQEGAWGCPKAS